MNPKDKAIESLKKEAEGLLSAANLISELIPDNLPEWATVGGRPSYLTIKIPYNFSYLRQLRRLLGKNWKVDHSFVSKIQGYLFIEYYHANRTNLTVIMETTKPGAVCQRKQVGVKEEPVYEIVCQ